VAYLRKLSCWCTQAKLIIVIQRSCSNEYSRIEEYINLDDSLWAVNCFSEGLVVVVQAARP
jgi:hypothetical protein